ncbi:tRNA (adenosine(37)-N6)-threonylcarbamoyltransferase complex dimerization subunit type 1 TsaB [Corynebacterium pseudotuberculosis]|uniref:tRNA (adenosine(37)-N6)-threonylcarbamoyltransferase complex dimerization subunit type 1 TsaB n=1 Tax=Corynebacterium pseudotuberculosis TaxID=1719 RepID=UPI000232476C|nr:tRNA (adenosine(37)-N6)-threonylcarbamoyltransferase complex dimerization subunit type 1 TsaB [Corynebacterium pseudotuberculosis]AER68505.1 Hypothetical protein Cp106_0406 [Corynebacterium pseudotuberculosis 1/06-A]AMN69499.1 tRNA (adenosine(37)-N6)-threonylcarbamoyltransferase complex dimerization subunit type 1 TsaB [Corynebacterium pseudotuberculosis]AMN71344.1 tRNA threonylcarbamoyladenosine biosynthesis protein TsaB [Corynebacterium pseudotuberculosis]AMN74004.1 tRNA (adenosine(37)-N6)
MLVLALDTATPDLIVGLVRVTSDTDTGVVVAQRILTDSRQHNELLTPTVVEILEESGQKFADIDRIVVGCGPGPFTGLRVGMVTAAAFGDALGIPVHGVCTHDAIANQLDGQALVATDARRKEIYWSLYSDGVRTMGPGIVAPTELSIPSRISTVSIPEKLGQLLPGPLRDVPQVNLRPLPECLVAVADFSQTPEPLEPLYLRRPDAKEPASKPRSSAIPKVEI